MPSTQWPATNEDSVFVCCRLCFVYAPSNLKKLINFNVFAWCRAFWLDLTAKILRVLFANLLDTNGLIVLSSLNPKRMSKSFYMLHHNFFSSYIRAHTQTLLRRIVSYCVRVSLVLCILVYTTRQSYLFIKIYKEINNKKEATTPTTIRRLEHRRRRN